MLRQTSERDNRLEMVHIEELVPKEHLLRKIDKSFDFEFIREKVAHLYCRDNGRPALDPVILFKILFLGYLYGVRSERQLIRDIQVNIAYRWFLGLGLQDKVPDASTLSQNRRRRFRESNVYQDIFDEVVFRAMKKGYVEGRLLYTDSTHLKANANRGKFNRVEAKASSKAYLEALEEDINANRKEHGKKPLPPKKDSKSQSKTKRESTTDPDSGFMSRPNKPEGFAYLDHRTVDDKYNIITDVHVTPGNVYDTIPYLPRIDRQQECFGFSIEAVGLDAGYNTADICKGLVEREIFGVAGYRRPTAPKGKYRKNDFTYIYEEDCYICPTGETLVYATTDRLGYQHYKTKACAQCHLKSQCTTSKQKVITRHVWEEHKETVKANRLSLRGKQIYKRRKETVERSFADAKQLHGYRYARFRGLNGVREQCLMTAICQNIKKMALLEWRELYLCICEDISQYFTQFKLRYA